MTSLNDFIKTDDVDDVLAALYNGLLGSLFRADVSNATVMTVTVTLTDADTPIQRFNCNGADRIVKLPAYSTSNHPFLIINATGAGYVLTIQNSAGTYSYATITDGESFYLVPDGATGYKKAMYSRDGWISVNESWSYASATTINIPSGGTTKYQKGMRIRYKQGGGYKYVVVIGVTNTLLTVTGGSDYSVANAAITDIYYSLENSPFGWPGWFNYAPTYSRTGTNYTNAPTTQLARFNFMPEGICKIVIYYTQNVTPGGSGQQLSSLPITAFTTGIVGLGFNASTGTLIYAAINSATTLLLNDSTATGSQSYGVVMDYQV